MKQLRLSHLAIVIAAIGFSAVPELSHLSSNIAVAQEAMRPEVGKLVQSANDLLKAKKFKDALGKLQETDRIGNKTVNESFTIERMRLTIATQSGDNDLTIRSAEGVLTANKLSAKDQLQIVQVLANSYYRAGNYAKAAKNYERYYADGGTDNSLRQYMIQAYSQSGDKARALKEVSAEIAAAEKAGRAPALATLELYSSLASSPEAKASAIEKMVAFHGKKEYWINLLNSISRNKDFSPRLSLDVFRLKLAVGHITKESEYSEMIEVAIQEGHPSEALRVIEMGMKNGVLGTGDKATRHTRLKDLAKKRADEAKAVQEAAEKEGQAAKDGNLLVKTGYIYAQSGQFDKGIDLMEQGIKKGDLKHPHDATLHLAMAYFQAGKKANAIKLFKKVEGKDGTADLARYWVIYANQSK
jgi:tetratricopeptide (TPR) repeat protein